jgi:hypothetical protein
MKVGKPTFILTCLNQYGSSGFFYSRNFREENNILIMLHDEFDR